jgi:hypothetical protein
MCFFGAARAHAIGLRWEKPYDDDEHSDPHCCESFCQFLQVDVCSVVGGCIEGMDAFSGKSELYYANKWTPQILPFMSVGVVLAGIKNFEVFFVLDKPMDGNVLFALTQNMIQIHKRRGGRSELRYGALSPSSIVYLDVSMRHGFGDVFQMLRDQLGVTRCALHDGKYDAIDTTPLARVRPYELEFS